jgi:hypothetical protein
MLLDMVSAPLFRFLSRVRRARVFHPRGAPPTRRRGDPRPAARSTWAVATTTLSTAAVAATVTAGTVAQ